MKAFVTLLIFVSCLMTASVAQIKQDSNAHMTFKGIPIDGSLNNFVTRMKENGFVHVGTEDGVAMFEGDFAAYKKCYIGILTLKGLNLVNSVTVIFPEQDTWASLSDNYLTIKELLSEKYGEPFEVIEEFNTRYSPSDDNSKMHEVRMNNCNYLTQYRTKNGGIQLSIENIEFSETFVRLSYYDKINSELIREKAIDDL